MSKERDLAESPTTTAEGQQICSGGSGSGRGSGSGSTSVLYTATAGEAAPQTVVRAGKWVGYALPVATGTASYAKIHIPINHLVKGSIVVT
jgi:hypothetical protein